MSRAPSLRLVAAAALVAGACATAPTMSSADAAAYTDDLLRKVGLEPTADSVVEESVYGDERVPVWRTRTEVAGGDVELAIEREGRYVLFLRDVADDGGPLLDVEQVAVVEAYSDNPAADRAAARVGGPALVAAGALAAVAVCLLVAAARGRLRP